MTGTLRREGPDRASGGCGAPETDRGACDVRGEAAAHRRGGEDVIVEDAAASGDALGAARRALRVARRRMRVVARVVPVGDPFPHVAGHVQHAVRACSARKRVDGRGVGVAVVVLRITPWQVAVAIAVVEPSGIEPLPPRIYALIGPAGGLLP